MQKMKSMVVFVLWLSSGAILAQVGQQRVDAKEAASGDAEREKHGLQILAKLTEKVSCLPQMLRYNGHRAGTYGCHWPNAR